MSHIVTIQTKVHDPNAVAAACRRLNLAAPVQGTTKLYSGEDVQLCLAKSPGLLALDLSDLRSSRLTPANG